MQETSTPANELLNRKQAAGYLGVSLTTLARWAGQRRGPRFFLVGHRARYSRADLDAFVAAQGVEPDKEGGR